MLACTPQGQRATEVTEFTEKRTYAQFSVSLEKQLSRRFHELLDFSVNSVASVAGAFSGLANAFRAEWM